MSRWFTWMASGKKDGLLAPALYVSIAIVIFAGITQGLASAGVVGLDAAQMATIWLWVAGLIVLLWIVYMISLAYVTAKRSGEVSAAERQVGTVPDDAESRPKAVKLPNMTAGASARPTPIQPEDRNEDNRVALHEALQNHSSIRVDMTEVFSHGCWLAPDPISEEQDKVTGERVFRYQVLDEDLEHEGPLRRTVVKILADQMKDLPTIAPYEPVKFEDLTVTPDDSLRAASIKPATPRQAPGSEPQAA